MQRQFSEIQGIFELATLATRNFLVKIEYFFFFQFKNEKSHRLEDKSSHWPKFMVNGVKD